MGARRARGLKQRGDGLAALGVALALACGLAAHPARADGDLDPRIDELTEQINAHPTDVRLYLERGVLHEQEDEHREAIADFETANQVAPGAPTVGYHLGRALLGAGNAARALTLLDPYLHAYPAHTDAYTVRARAHRALGHAREAVADYDRALERTAQPSPEQYAERAAVLIERGGADVDEGLASLRAGVARLGPVVSLIELAVRAEQSRGHDAAGLPWLAQLPAPLRETPRWRSLEGDLLHAAGRTPEALVAWRAGLAAVARLPASRQNVEAVRTLREGLERRVADAELASARPAEPPRATPSALQPRPTRPATTRGWGTAWIGAVVLAVLALAGIAAKLRAPRRPS